MNHLIRIDVSVLRKYYVSRNEQRPFPANIIHILITQNKQHAIQNNPTVKNKWRKHRQNKNNNHQNRNFHKENKWIAQLVIKPIYQMFQIWTKSLHRVCNNVHQIRKHKIRICRLCEIDIAINSLFVRNDRV